MIGKRGVIGIGTQSSSLTASSMNWGFLPQHTPIGMVDHNSRTMQYNAMRSIGSWELVTKVVNPMTAGGETEPKCAVISSDGNHFYVSNYDKVQHWKLEVPYDLSTKTYLYEINFDSGSRAFSSFSFVWSADGTYCTFGSTNYDDLFQLKTKYPFYLAYQTGLPSDTNWYQVARFSGDAKSTNVYGTGTGYGTDNEGLFIKPDGTKFYLIDYDDDRVMQWTMTTPWDPTTKSSPVELAFNSSSMDGSSGNIETVPRDLFFSPDGSKLFITGTGNDDLHRIDLTTAWDISLSNCTYYGAWVKSSEHYGFAFSPDGTKYAFGNSSGYVGVYEFSTAWDVTGTKTLVGSSQVSSSSDFTGVSWNSDGTQLAAVATNDRVYWLNFATGYDWSSKTFGDNSYSGYYSSTQLPQKMYYLRGCCFAGPNGDDYLFILDAESGATNRKGVYRAEMLTPGDLYTSENGWHTMDTEGNGDFDSMHWSSDGRHLYICDASDDRIRQYTVRSEFPAYFVNSHSIDYVGYLAVMNAPRGVGIMPNGKDMYVATSDGDYIRHYKLTTPWQINTGISGTYVEIISGNRQGGYPRDLNIDKDGRSMILTEETNDDIWEWRQTFV